MGLAASLAGSVALTGSVAVGTSVSFEKDKEGVSLGPLSFDPRLSDEDLRIG